MTVRVLVLAPVLALALSGCAMAPQPAPPATLSTPAQWRTALVAGAPVERDWWRAFGDPVLDQLVQQAQQNNGDVRVALSRLQEYQARVRVAASAQAPALTASLNPTRARALGSSGPVDGTAFTGQVQASYELDLFGRLASTTAAARFDLQAQEALAAATTLAVAANTASAYLNLRGLDAQLALARATLVSRQRSYDLARRQYEVGYSSRLDQAQAEAELHTTAAVVPQLERAIAQQENALSVLLGASPGAVARGAALPDLRPPSIGAGMPSELLRRRPDIAQAESTLAALDASLAAARDQLLPSIRLSASLGAEAGSLAQLLRAPNALWSIGGSILAPIFDGGRLRAQAEIAGTLRDRAVFGYEAAVRTAFSETDNALTAVQRLGEQLVEAQARQLASAEVLRVAHNRYANGYASYLEELDAQRNAFAADNNVLQLRASLLAAHVDLYRALGGGWRAA
ncbi:efflux transporter outer membrane subunit [Massilia sp. S19_KUP03_FR1]|uniref:efflux transporter outer membrane subunit n=1 Tax=Massilia sp. S19_KUP03_FR1 TaxID=3025503 RepID=UPI002FCDA8FE